MVCILSGFTKWESEEGGEEMRGFCILMIFFVFIFFFHGEIYAVEVKESLVQTGQEGGKQGVKEEVEENKKKDRKDRSGKGKGEKKKVGGEKKSEKEKLEEIKENLFPLEKDSLLWLRKKTEEYEKVKDFEMYPKRGKVRWFYFGKDDVCEIKLAVSRVTTVCFWGEIDEKGGVVVGDEELFRVQIVENKRCVSFFPLKKFKESNAMVFVSGIPWAFTLREVYDVADMDYVVFAERKPSVSVDSFLKMIVSGERPRHIFSFVKEEKGERGRRYIFDGDNRVEVREIEESEVCEGVSYCVGKSCYCAVEKQ